MLEVLGLDVYYGAIHALHDISFEVKQGEIVTLIGANGAGKTSILHAISHLIPVKNGTMAFDGKDITRMEA
ncbi:MAG: ATP-binding cassette domain-containing protein, partial [Clostridia bacterium]